MNRRGTLVGAICLLAAGCSTPKPQSSNEYFSAGDSMFRSGAYGLAIENYREMIDQYPFGDQTEEAELRIAHAHYLNESYIEAIAAFTDFQRRHPTSPFLPFVGYELGMAYKQQMGTIDRDQSAARNADIYFSAVIAQYADSPYAELSREELRSCRDSMAQHELYVARFYLRKGNFTAVENRSLDIVGQWPESSAADEALYGLARLYEESDEPRRATLAYAALVEDHPLSSRAPEASAALERLHPDGSVGPAAREALLAAAKYEPSHLASGADVPVPGIVKDDRPFAPPGGLGGGYPGAGAGPSAGPARGGGY